MAQLTFLRRSTHYALLRSLFFFFDLFYSPLFFYFVAAKKHRETEIGMGSQVWHFAKRKKKSAFILCTTET